MITYGKNKLHSDNPRRDNEICTMRLQRNKIKDVRAAINRKYRPRISDQRVSQILARAKIRHADVAVVYRWKCANCPRVEWLSKKQCEKKYCSLQCRKKFNIFPHKLKKEFTEQDYKIYWKILNDRQSRKDARLRYYLRNKDTFHYKERRRITGRERYRLAKMQS